MSTPLPGFVRFGRAVCGDLEQAERREWWVTNGLGGYAAGTVAGSLTRRYHGLLVAPLTPPLGRHLVLAKADATLRVGGVEHPLFVNRWVGGALEPAGHVHIESFHLEGRVPVWRYAIGAVSLETRVWMDYRQHRTYVAYRLVAATDDTPVELRVALLANARDHHGVTRAGGLQPEVAGGGGRLVVRHPGWFALHLQAAGGELTPDRTWVERFDLSLERERGLEAIDNHLRVGHASFVLPPGRWVGLSAGLEPAGPLELEAALERARDRDRSLLALARQEGAVLAGGASAGPAAAGGPTPDPASGPWVEQLVLAADSFLFARPLPEVPDGESVIAGYPWFGDWGRDTMIALPGLTLATGRAESARRILESFARFVDQGMLPNVFPGSGATPEYNTVDAALWYVEAWRAYVEATSDIAALERVFPVLAAIIRWHQQGTRYGIKADPGDGLLRAGEPGAQLTWMDARVGDWVVTPRIGKPVEVNALWHNALRAMAALGAQLGQDGAPYAALAERARQGFQRFVRPDGGGLYDVLDGPDGNDASVRPNQLLAVSLPYSPLEPTTRATVVRVCGHALLTSCGLRSLAPSDPAYRPHYRGGVWDRDGAYHQGTVWGWLLGHYALAEYRVTGDARAALARLEPLADHLLDAGLGTVSEIFDGAPPHRPRGAPAQAWSVACTLEAQWRLRAKRGHS
jgi:4-alpha-glucanotransferase